MKQIFFKFGIALSACLFTCMTLAQEQQLNIICSVQSDWCNLIQVTFPRVSGIKVNIVQRSTGEALAQIAVEKANPKTEIWFGGTGDPHLAAAQQELTLVYQSPSLKHLHPWAQTQAAQSAGRSVGIYLGPLGIFYNKEVLAKENYQSPLHGLICCGPNTKVKFKWPTQALVGPPIRLWPPWCNSWVKPLRGTI